MISVSAKEGSEKDTFSNKVSRVRRLLNRSMPINEKNNRESRVRRV